MIDKKKEAQKENWWEQKRKTNRPITHSNPVAMI